MNLNARLIFGFVLSIFLSITCVSVAQTGDSDQNLVKLNLPSLFLKTFNAQYERAIFGKTSVGLGIRIMPKGTLPFSASFATDDDQLGSLSVGNFAITPEIKFYLGKDVFKGFYVAPFLRYANYNASINYEFYTDNQLEIIPLAGKLSTFTAGILIGAQWRLAHKFYLDWSIFGPQYGLSNGNLAGTKTLTAQEQRDLKDELDGIELPVGKISSTVNSKGVIVDLKGPWAGIRANIGVGYRF